MRRRTSALAASPLVTSVKVTVIAECACQVERDGMGEQALRRWGVSR